jgi:predicted MFS family arabinose efflux permease
VHDVVPDSSSGAVRHDILAIIALALAPAIGLGIARFAYALVLPDMRADLGWSYADAGWMNTTNAAGYLLGASLAVRAIATLGAFRVMAIGVWTCIAALALCALFRQAVPLNMVRLLAGLGGGFAFVAGGVMAAGIAQRNPARGAFLLGLFYAGPGLGILLSGLCVPFVLEWLGPGSWNTAWALLAAISLLLAIGLFPVRGEGGTSVQTGRQGKSRYRDMRWLLCGYLFFGAGYIAFMTFMIAWIQGGGRSAGFQALFWAVIGLAAMASPWLWAGVLKRLLHGYAFAVLTGVTMVGAALPLLSGTVAMLLASAALFGCAFFAVVATTTVFVRRNLPQAQWATGIAMLTVVFGIGQMLGPVVIGILNDLTQGLAGGLWASVLLLFIAALVGMVQRDFEAL